LDISATTITALRINGTAGNAGSNNTQLRLAGGKSGELWAVGTDIANNNGSKDFHIFDLSRGTSMTFQSGTGNIGIGTTNPQYPLSVNGIIQAKEVLVNSGWSDYVFAPDYHLRDLYEISAYIQQNHHLPEIPSASEVQEKGVSLGDMQAKLLAKVEELTLHMIQEHERNDRLEERNRSLREELSELRSLISRDIAPSSPGLEAKQ
jgi:hypothetical protein